MSGERQLSEEEQKACIRAWNDGPQAWMNQPAAFGAGFEAGLVHEQQREKDPDGDWRDRSALLRRVMGYYPDPPSRGLMVDIEACLAERNEFARCLRCGTALVVYTTREGGPVGPVYCPKCEPRTLEGL